jgi:hypothetical protein
MAVPALALFHPDAVALLQSQLETSLSESRPWFTVRTKK